MYAALIYRFQTGAGVSGPSSPSFVEEEAMNGLSLFTVVFVWGELAFAQNGISVRVCSAVYIPDKILDEAKVEASFVLKTGGLKVTLVRLQHGNYGADARASDFLCSALVPVLSSGAERHGRLVLGGAPRSNRTEQISVSLYYDSITKVARNHSALWQASQILGYSIAHELGHLLLGAEHAPSGVMRANWDASDLLLMSRHAIKFTAEERERINKGWKPGYMRGSTTEARPVNQVRRAFPYRTRDPCSISCYPQKC